MLEAERKLRRGWESDALKAQKEKRRKERRTLSLMISAAVVFALLILSNSPLLFRSSSLLSSFVALIGNALCAVAIFSASKSFIENFTSSKLPTVHKKANGQVALSPLPHSVSTPSCSSLASSPFLGQSHSTSNASSTLTPNKKNLVYNVDEDEGVWKRRINIDDDPGLQRYLSLSRQASSPMRPFQQPYDISTSEDWTKRSFSMDDYKRSDLGSGSDALNVTGSYEAQLGATRSLSGIGLDNISLASQKFHPSIRVQQSIAKGITPHHNLNKSRHDIQNAEAASEVLSKLGVQHMIEYWTENLRIWLAESILKPLVKSIELVEKDGGLYVASYTDPICRSCGRSNIQPATSFFSLAGSTPATNPSILERMRVNHYLNPIHSASREYVVNRIKTLGKGGFISEYKWNAGGRWKDEEWTPELPTDASILMSLFSSYMDLQFVGGDLQTATNTYVTHASLSGPGSANATTSSNRPFSSKHFLVHPDTLDSKAIGNERIILIYQAHVHPPHFEVIINNYKDTKVNGKNAMDELRLNSDGFNTSSRSGDQEDIDSRATLRKEKDSRYPIVLNNSESNPQQRLYETFPVQQGRNNLFYAIVLLLYLIKTEFAGYLGPVNLAGRSIRLIQLVSP